MTDETDEHLPAASSRPTPALDAPGTAPPETVILIVAFQSRFVLPACLNSVAQASPGVPVVVVDNGSTDESAELIADEFPWVHLLRSPENQGFTGGNNFGWDYIRYRWPDLTAVMLLNPDTVVSPGWLTAAEAVLAAEPRAALVQAKLRLTPETDLINTLGNEVHYLGFGLMRRYRDLDDGQPSEPVRIPSASGAACLVRVAAIESPELLDSRFFLYVEDVELSLRVRLAGWQVWLAPASVVFHQHQLVAPQRNYFYLERNRWLLLLTFLNRWTLFSILPALLLMEAGQWLFALRHGLVKQRLRMYRVLWKTQTRRDLKRRRLHIQSLRRITDRELLAECVSTFDRRLLPGWLVQYVANPLFATWWWIIRRFL